MGHGTPTSAYWYLGRLGPVEATRFNVQEVPVTGGDVRLEIYHDRIGIWSRPGPNQVRDLGEAQELVALVAGAYALVTRIALDWAIEGWVEATEASFTGTVMGVVPDTRAWESPMLTARAARCIHMGRAARLAAFAWRRPGYRLALRDFHAAYHDRGDDAFMFAYRAIEDVARAVSGQTGELRSSDYDSLPARLNLAPDQLTIRKHGLSEARAAAAHGNEGDPVLLGARMRRQELIDVGRVIAAEALAHEPKAPVRLEWLVP